MKSVFALAHCSAFSMPCWKRGIPPMPGGSESLSKSIWATTTAPENSFRNSRRIWHGIARKTARCRSRERCQTRRRNSRMSGYSLNCRTTRIGIATSVKLQRRMSLSIANRVTRMLRMSLTSLRNTMTMQLAEPFCPNSSKNLGMKRQNTCDNLCNPMSFGNGKTHG